MCGICGTFRYDNEPVNSQLVLQMRDTMIARGPDSAGISNGDNYSLGHRRLAIIDLSAAGHQPMSNEDGSIEVVFNGEIYNFRELRRDLERGGHQFVSKTDTEVLVHGYEAWGIKKLLQRIRGMFSFAIVDRDTETIHLARDPLGQKPLFYYNTPSELFFASSLPALLLALDTEVKINEKAIDNLLCNLFIPTPMTFIEGVKKLRPGHFLTAQKEFGCHETSYWRPDFLHPDFSIGVEEWLERIESSLSTAIKRRLVADVPLGVLLSGGIDSGLVAALAAKISGGIKTFSVATASPEHDESRYARMVASKYDTIHNELSVSNNIRRGLPKLIYGMGEPLADASLLNVFSIAELARRSVTIVLTGDGGDEGFGGYRGFWVNYHADQMRRWLPALIQPSIRNLGIFLQNGPGAIRQTGTLLRYAGGTPAQNVSTTNWLDMDTRHKLFTTEFMSRMISHDSTSYYRNYLHETTPISGINQYMQVHLLTTLADDYLPKVDYGTMANSLEARSPFLDQDLIELAMKIPASIRFLGGKRKGLLKELARRYLPSEIIDLPKRGFIAPVGLWLRNDWSDLVDEMVLGEHVEYRGWFRRHELQRLVTENRNKGKHAYLIWTLLMMELWIRIHIEHTLDPNETL